MMELDVPRAAEGPPPPPTIQTPPYACRDTVAFGRGLVATRNLAAGTRLFTEYPHLAQIDAPSAARGYRACARCVRLLGPLDQLASEMLGTTVALPPLLRLRAMPPPVRCPGGCDRLAFCSTDCALAEYNESHCLLCPGGGGGEGAAALASFEAHARETNEVFLLAARAIARVLVALAGGRSPAEAMEHFPGLPWWDAVPPPEDEDPAEFQQTLRVLLEDSWRLLVPVLARRVPSAGSGGAVALLQSFDAFDAYARIVGTFERRACALAVASPIEEYLLAVDELPEGVEYREAATAAGAALRDALGDEYDVPCEGIGLYPLQAMMNHSCVPNVTLIKPEPEDEHDGRVVASLSRDVAAGEELTNAYVDIDLPLDERARELRDYGFVCHCSKCELERAEVGQGSGAAGGRARCMVLE